jgi:hypothetical protein
MDSQLDAASLSGSKLGNWNERKASLTRSQTDSNITYAGEDIPEAPGSACYITKEGDIDFQVVLKVSIRIREEFGNDKIGCSCDCASRQHRLYSSSVGSYSESGGTFD